jgi:hypothetical protein
MNKQWHAAHVLGKGAYQSERIAWHRAHQKHCACRPIPKSLAAFIEPSSATKEQPPGARPRSGKGR